KPEHLVKLLVKAKVMFGEKMEFSAPLPSPTQFQTTSNEEIEFKNMDEKMQNFLAQFGTETLLRSAYKRCSMNMYKRISGTERDCLERLTQTVEKMTSLSAEEQYLQITALMKEIEEQHASNKKSPLIRLIHKMQQALLPTQQFEASETQANTLEMSSPKSAQEGSLKPHPHHQPVIKRDHHQTSRPFNKQNDEMNVRPRRAKQNHQVVDRPHRDRPHRSGQ